MEGQDERICLWCFEALVQNEGETWQNFQQRKFCNRSHGALHTNSVRKHPKRSISCFLSPLTL